MASLLDRNGRLFGRWNLIDLAAVGVVAGLLWSGYAAVQIISGNWRRVPMRHGRFPLVVQATFVGLEPEVARLIQAGDVELDSKGRMIAKILEVGEPEPEWVTLRYGKNDWVKEAPNPVSGRLDVPVRMWIDSERRGDTLYFKERPVGSGTRIGFHTPTYRIQAIVYDEAWIDVVVVCRLMSWWQLQDVLQSVGKIDVDLHHQPMAKLLRMESVIPVDPSGRDDKLRPEDRQYALWLRIRVKCTFVRGILRYKGNAVIKGQSLLFQFSEKPFYGEVQEIHQMSPAGLVVEIDR